MYRSTLPARNCIIGVIAWQRFRAVSRPMSTLQSESHKPLIRFLIILYTFSILLSVCRVLYSCYLVCEKDIILIRWFYFTFNIFYKFEHIFDMIYLIGSTLISFCVIIISSLEMLIILKRRQNKLNILGLLRSNTNNRNDQDSRSITRIVFLLCAAFAICELPLSILTILVMAFHFSNFNLIYIVYISHVLPFVDSLLNFFIYFYFIKDFRQFIFNILCFKRLSSNQNRNKEVSRKKRPNIQQNKL